MNEDTVRGKWKQLRGKVRERWGELTDDSLDQIEGKRDQVAGLLQEKYGYAKERAQKEYDDFVKDLKDEDWK